MATNGWQQLFDLRDPSDVLRAIETIERFRDVYSGFISGLSRQSRDYQNAINSIINSTRELQNRLENLDSATEEGRRSMADISKQAELNSEAYNTLTGRISTLEARIKQLTSEQQALETSSRQLNKTQQQTERLQQRLANSTGETAEEQAVLREQINRNNRANRQAAREALGLVSVYQQEAQRLSELRQEFRDVALTQGLASDEAQRLQREIADLDGTLREVDASAGQFQRNVGNYPDLFEQVGGAGGIAINAVRGLGAAFTALIANPIVAVLAALVGGLTLVFNAFRNSAVGAQLFEAIGTRVNALFTALTSIVNQAIPVITGIFEDPLGALRNFGEFLVSQVVNRFQALIQLGGLLGRALRQLFTGEFSALSDTASEAGDALAQLATGLDPDQRDSVTSFLADTSKEASNTVNALEDLRQATERVRIANRQLAVETARLANEEQNLQGISDDATLSFQAREQAAEDARQAVERRIRSELEASQNSLDLINREVEIRRAAGEDIRDLLDQQAQAQQEVIRIEGELTEAIRQNEQERRQLRQDRLERDLDILIDGLDNQRTINERIIADDRRTLAFRRSLLEETQQLATDSFDAQIATIQQFTDQQIDANELLQASDARTLNERIRALGLSEIIEGRLLEVIRDRRTALQDLSEAGQDLVDAERDRDRELANLSQNELDRQVEILETRIDVNGATIDLIDKRVQAEVDAENRRREDAIENARQTIADETLLAATITDIRANSENEINDIQRRGAEERTNILETELEREQRILRERVDLIFSFANQISAFFNALAERQNQRDQERLDALTRREEEALEQAGENERERAAIQQEFARERESIERQQQIRQRRQAVFEKAIAVSQSIVNTALGITNALTRVATIPLIPIIAAQGALQTAAILAQPIPSFFKGTDDAPGGKSLVSELGPELVIEKSGKMYVTGPKPEVRDIPKGSTILNHIITKGLLGPNPTDINESSSEAIHNFLENSRNQAIQKQTQLLLRSNRSMENAMGNVMKGVEIHQWKMTGEKITRSVRRGNTIFKNWKSVNSYE